jgi:hypothetical protein
MRLDYLGQEVGTAKLAKMGTCFLTFRKSIQKKAGGRDNSLGEQ